MQSHEFDDFDDVPTSEHPPFFLLLLLLICAVVCPILFMTAHSYLLRGISIADSTMQSTLFFAIATALIGMYCVRCLLHYAIECHRYYSAAAMSGITVVVAIASVAYAIHNV